MNEQWQELKETITEMRDNNGTGTQQEVCKFLANYMDILERQRVEPTDMKDTWSIKDVIDAFKRHGLIREQEPKTGNWIRVTDKAGYLVWECDKCGWQQRYYTNFCPDCGCCIVEPQESEDKE